MILSSKSYTYCQSTADVSEEDPLHLPLHPPEAKEVFPKIQTSFNMVKGDLFPTPSGLHPQWHWLWPESSTQYYIGRSTGGNVPDGMSLFVLILNALGVDYSILNFMWSVDQVLMERKLALNYKDCSQVRTSVYLYFLGHIDTVRESSWWNHYISSCNVLGGTYIQHPHFDKA